MTMKLSFARWTSLTALMCGLCAVDGVAQTADRGQGNRFQSTPAPSPGLTPRLLYPGGYQPPRLASALQEPTPDAPSPNTPAASGPVTEPTSPSGSGGTANATD